jgi:hypothetical protein
LAIALVFPFYEPPVVVLIDWSSFSFHVSKPAMLLISLGMLIVRVAAPVFLVRYQFGGWAAVAGGLLRLAPRLSGEGDARVAAV